MNTTINRSEIKCAHALRLAELGFRIHPLPANSKIPEAGTKWKKDATSDAETIRRWFRENPHANYIAAPSEDYFITDLDVKDGRNGLRDLEMLALEYGDLPDTLLVKTPSGGLHFYWRGTAPLSVGKKSLGGGIDIRGNCNGRAGYVLGPGSQIGGKPYEIVADHPIAAAPDWLVQLCSQSSSPALKRAEGVELDSDIEVSRMRDYLVHRVEQGDVAVSGCGGNNRTYKLFAELMDYVSPEIACELVAESWNGACVPPWSDSEFSAICEHAAAHRQNDVGAKTSRPASEAFKDYKPREQEHEVISIPHRHRREARYSSAATSEPFDWHRPRTKKREPFTDDEVTEYLTTRRSKKKTAAERGYAARFAFIAAGLRRGHTPEELLSLMMSHLNDVHLHDVRDAYEPPEATLREELERICKRLSDDFDRVLLPIVVGQEAKVIDQIERVIVARSVPIFENGDRIVRPGEFTYKDKRGIENTSIALIDVTGPSFADMLSRDIEFQKANAKGEMLPTPCPDNIVKAFLARKGQHVLRPVTGITLVPVLRKDGSVLNEPGYDVSTGLIYEPGNVTFPDIPAAPSKDDAVAAINMLLEPLAKFPFVSDADKAVALSGMLSLVAKRIVGNVPLHGFDAPIRGSGKSMLVDMMAMIATGARSQHTPLNADDIENTKTLATLLKQGSPVISFDNLTTPLGFELLESMLASERIECRILGMTKSFVAINNAVVFANGNNLRVKGDMARRAIMGSINPQMERPELRQFSFDPVAMIEQDRPGYVIACLAILRAFILAGKPVTPGPLGSFEEWSALVRGALLWLGQADPCETMSRLTDASDEAMTFGNLLAQWEAVVGSKAVTAKGLIAAASDKENGGQVLWDAVTVVAGDRGSIDTRKLGDYLLARKERVAGGRWISQDGISEGSRRWKLCVRK